MSCLNFVNSNQHFYLYGCGGLDFLLSVFPLSSLIFWWFRQHMEIFPYFQAQQCCSTFPLVSPYKAQSLLKTKLVQKIWICKINVLCFFLIAAILRSSFTLSSSIFSFEVFPFSTISYWKSQFNQLKENQVTLSCIFILLSFPICATLTRSTRCNFSGTVFCTLSDSWFFSAKNAPLEENS